MYSILRFHVNLPGCNHNFAYSSEGNEFKRISRSFSSNSFSCRTKSMVIVIGGWGCWVKLKYQITTDWSKQTRPIFSWEWGSRIGLPKHTLEMPQRVCKGKILYKHIILHIYQLQTCQWRTVTHIIYQTNVPGSSFRLNMPFLSVFNGFHIKNKSSRKKWSAIFRDFGAHLVAPLKRRDITTHLGRRRAKKPGENEGCGSLGWCRITRPGTSRYNNTGPVQMNFLESRWCPIFKAKVAGFRGKVA